MWLGHAESDPGGCWTARMNFIVACVNFEHILDFGGMFLTWSFDGRS